jgi:heat shock protein HtpX
MQFGFYGGGMGYGYGGRDYDRSNNAGAMIIIIVVAMLTWLLSFLIIRAISRYREFAADRGAAQMTGKPVKLANALMKISGSMHHTPTKDLRPCRRFECILYHSCTLRQHNWKSLFDSSAG